MEDNRSPLHNNDKQFHSPVSAVTTWKDKRRHCIKAVCAAAAKPAAAEYDVEERKADDEKGPLLVIIEHRNDTLHRSDKPDHRPVLVTTVWEIARHA